MLRSDIHEIKTAPLDPKGYYKKARRFQILATQADDDFFYIPALRALSKAIDLTEDNLSYKKERAILYVKMEQYKLLREELGALQDTLMGTDAASRLSVLCIGLNGIERLPKIKVRELIKDIEYFFKAAEEQRKKPAVASSAESSLLTYSLLTQNISGGASHQITVSSEPDSDLKTVSI